MRLEKKSSNMLKERYSIADFSPLILIFVGVFAVSLYSYIQSGDDLMTGMRVFMAAFFLVFGFLKVIRLSAFAEAYQMYDLIAARSKVYAYLYPFIELGLGVAYVFNIEPLVTNWITLIVMLLSALGVYLKLKKGEKILCACLGTVFKVPMTWVTLFEDLLMAAMALYMLFVIM